MSARPGHGTRNSAGRFAPLGIRIHLDDRSNVSEVIATKDVIVHDDALGIDRCVFAGQPVPGDLVAAYRAETGEEPAEEVAPADDASAPERPRRGTKKDRSG